MKQTAPEMVMDYLKNGDFFIRETHRFGKTGTCYSLDPDLQNVNYWMFNYQDLFTISVSDMLFERDFTRTFPSTDYLSLYYYDSIDGYELPDGNPIPRGCISVYIASGDSFTATYRANVPVQGVSINITPEYYEAYLAAKLPGGFTRLKNAFLALDCREENADLLLVMKQIQNCRMTGRSAQLYYESKVNEAISLVVNRAETPRRNIPCSIYDKQQLVQIERYIALHYAENINLSHLAGIACMSISKLKYTFKAMYGCNISEYLNEYRLSQAKKMLQDNQRSVTNIANLTGYKTTSSFTKMFKEKTGMLPSEYRKSAMGPQ